MIEILIADDNAVQANQLANILTNEKDFKVIKIAYNGEDALKDYYNLNPDVMLLDLDMPKKNGIEVINSLSSTNELNPKKNILIVSGSDYYRNIISDTNRVRFVFQKPIDYPRLFSEIREIKKNSEYKPSFKNDLDNLFEQLNMKSYTKGTIYLKTAIRIAYYDSSFQINISNITKRIALENNIDNYNTIQSTMDKAVHSMYYKHSSNKVLKELFSTTYKFTTKDFIAKSIEYIEKK